MMENNVIQFNNDAIMIEYILNCWKLCIGRKEMRGKYPKINENKWLYLVKIAQITIDGA